MEHVGKDKAVTPYVSSYIIELLVTVHVFLIKGENNFFYIIILLYDIPHFAPVTILAALSCKFSISASRFVHSCQIIFAHSSL